MAERWKKVDDKTVLAYLKSKRAALDQAIAALEGVVGNMTETVDAGSSLGEVQSDSFVGMNIATASTMYLKMVGRPARTTEEIHNALAKGGLPDFTRESVATILQRMHNQNGDVVRVSKGVWGLAEWYPNRPKTTKRKSQEGAEQRDPSVEKDTQPKSKQRKEKKAKRSQAVTDSITKDVTTIAGNWLRLVRDAGTDGISTPKLAAGLGYDSGRSVPFLAIKVNKRLVQAKLDPKTVYEGRRVGTEQRWFPKEKIEEALKSMKG